jgi:hypothetical protein
MRIRFLDDFHHRKEENGGSAGGQGKPGPEGGEPRAAWNRVEFGRRVRAGDFGLEEITGGGMEFKRITGLRSAQAGGPYQLFFDRACWFVNHRTGRGMDLGYLVEPSRAVLL